MMINFRFRYKMCIVIIKRSLNPNYSFFIGMNREERYTKHWDEISNYWEQYPEILGYRDHDSGGTWFAYNDNLTAILLNRESDKYQHLQSRSKIIFLSLKTANTLETAVENLLKVDVSSYKPFNLILVDNKNILWATNFYDNTVKSQTSTSLIKDDLIFVNRSHPNDLSEKRIALNIDKFRILKEPNPIENIWDDWSQILTTKCYAELPAEEKSLWLDSKEWGTLSSEIIAVPRTDKQSRVIHRVKTRW